MRTQWCREHIDQTAKECGLSLSAVSEVKQATKFCDEHSEFSELPTKPIIALIRVQDAKIRERAIIKCKERLNGKRGAGRGNTKELTESEVKKIIDDVVREIRMELVVEIRKEQPIDQPDPRTVEEVNAEILAEDVRLRALQEPSVIVYTVTQAELDSYFEVMKKIGCTGDMPRHKSRIEKMIEDKTLIVG